MSGLNTGRFLDPPEFTVIHAKGNEENLFDRIDYQVSKADSIQLNLGFTRSWFQNPNSFDNVLHTGQTDPAAIRLDQPISGPKIKNLQHCAVVDSVAQRQLGFHLGRIRPQRSVQLLPQSQCVRRSFSHSTGNDCAGSLSHKCRSYVAAFSYVKGMHNLKVGQHISRHYSMRTIASGSWTLVYFLPRPIPNGNPCFVNGVAWVALLGPAAV